MPKKPDRTGEYLSLTWDCEDTAPEYVRGHVSAEKFVEVLRHESARQDLTLPPVRHRWARWTKAPAGAGYDVAIHLYDKPGPGAFAVTEAQHDDLYPARV